MHESMPNNLNLDNPKLTFWLEEINPRFKNWNSFSTNSTDIVQSYTLGLILAGVWIWKNLFSHFVPSKMPSLRLFASRSPYWPLQQRTLPFSFNFSYSPTPPFKHYPLCIFLSLITKQRIPCHVSPSPTRPQTFKTQYWQNRNKWKRVLNSYSSKISN
jgi:hypothetical protein